MISLLVPLSLAVASPVVVDLPIQAGDETYTEALQGLDSLARSDSSASERIRAYRALRARALTMASNGMYEAVVDGTSLRVVSNLSGEAGVNEMGRDLRARAVESKGQPPKGATPRLSRPIAEDVAAGVAMAGELSALVYAGGVEEALAERGFDDVRGFRAFTGAAAYVAAREDVVVVVFVGTEADIRDLVADVRVARVPGNEYGGGEVHDGFERQLSSLWTSIRSQLERLGKSSQNRPVVFTGHSLGGALATLAFARARTALLFPRFPNGPSAYLITVGTPAAGDAAFAKGRVFSKDAVYRVVHGVDAVPQFPSALIGFRHPERSTVIYFHDGRVTIDADPTSLPQVHDPISLTAIVESERFAFADHNEYNYAVLGARFWMHQQSQE